MITSEVLRLRDSTCELRRDLVQPSQVAHMVKNLPTMQETQVWALGWEDPLEKGMATHLNILAWRIPWTEELEGLQSMGSQRVGHDWGTSLSLFTFMHWRRKWQPTPVFLPGESQGRGSLAGCHPWGRTVRHDLSNLAAAAADSKARMFFSQRERCTQRKVKEYKN